MTEKLCLNTNRYIQFLYIFNDKILICHFLVQS
jgi:hypothetical protein